jgi:hypothetical protein
VKFTTDKICDHGYYADYLRLAAELGPAAAVCEVGVYHGESLDMLQALYPDGTVIGVDSNPDCTWPDGTIRIVSGQDSPGLPILVTEHAPDGCDLIIDDASHIGRLSAATFRLLWPLVRPGGFYVVEDWADPLVLPGWGAPDPADRLIDWVPGLTAALGDGAAEVRYTWLGLAIIRRKTTEGTLAPGQLR